MTLNDLYGYGTDDGEEWGQPFDLGKVLRQAARIRAIEQAGRSKPGGTTLASLFGLDGGLSSFDSLSGISETNKPLARMLTLGELFGTGK
jgi:hypothetical protein